MNMFELKLQKILNEIDSILEIYEKFLSVNQYEKLLLIKKLTKELFNT